MCPTEKAGGLTLAAKTRQAQLRRRIRSGARGGAQIWRGAKSSLLALLLLQACELLLEKELLALGAELLDFACEHIVFINF